MRRMCGVFVLAAIAIAVVMRPVPAAAQAQPGTGADPLLDMRAIARALGVPCNHCHVQGDFTSDANPKKVIARQMIAMTRGLNAAIASATGKASGEATRVHCANCHRGTTVPQTLSEALTATLLKKGPEAAVEQYRDLRSKFYAKDTYDFSESELLNFLAKVAESRPDSALPLLRMNLEFNPKSAATYILMARVHQRKLDNATAIEMLNKALEIEPENGFAQGFIYQLAPRLK